MTEKTLDLWPLEKALVDLTKDGEDHDWSGWVYHGNEMGQLLAEDVGTCWAHATAWLKARGIDLPQDYEIEKERGGYRYIYHEQY